MGDSNIRILENLERLPEDNHDFKIKENNEVVIIQLTELFDITFSIKNNLGFYDSEVYFKITSQALAKNIESKLDKKYQKPKNSKFWLVIYTVSPYVTEFWQNGKINYSQGLIEAKKLLTSRQDNPFDEIWFTDLLTRPVRIYP
jgi:hypothetical protein